MSTNIYVYRHDCYKNEADRLYQLISSSSSEDDIADYKWQIEQLEYLDSKQPTNKEIVEFAKFKINNLPDFNLFKQKQYETEYMCYIESIRKFVDAYELTQDEDLVYEIDRLSSELYLIQECGEATPKYRIWK